MGRCDILKCKYYKSAVGLHIKCIFFLNLRPESQSQSELLRMHGNLMNGCYGKQR